MTLKQEIKKTLKNNCKNIIHERIIPELKDSISVWANELIKKLTTLNPEDDFKLAERTTERIKADLVGETIRQLLELQYKRNKRISA